MLGEARRVGAALVPLPLLLPWRLIAKKMSTEATAARPTPRPTPRPTLSLDDSPDDDAASRPLPAALGDGVTEIVGLTEAV